jgi:hypothetical protein
MGDISKNAQGVRVQGVKITGIPLENARLAIRMCQIKPKRIMTDAQKASLAPKTGLQTAASGFKNQGQFIAALHVSHNRNIPFDQLKTDMMTSTIHSALPFGICSRTSTPKRSTAM